MSKKVFALCLLSLLFFGCSKDTAKTITADVVAPALSSTIISTLSCAATQVVTDDVKAVVNKWFSVQSETQKGVVQNLCKAAIADIVPTLIGATVPTTWQCKLTALENAVTIIGDAACKNL
jgi:hypothetical protein